MVPEKRAQERSVRESEEILNPLRLFDAALVLVSDEAASPALDEYVRLHLLGSIPQLFEPYRSCALR